MPYLTVGANESNKKRPLVQVGMPGTVSAAERIFESS